MAQPIKRPTLGSGHDLTVRGFEPQVKPHVVLRADSAEPAWDPLSLPFPDSYFLSLSLSKKQIDKLLFFF